MNKTNKNNSVWYIAGLHFECLQCGNCCAGPEEGVIWISRAETEKLAVYLGLTVSQLRKKYLKRYGFRYSIKEDPSSKDCIFLTNKGCSIYDLRPAQCKNWPFWASNLKTPNHWNAAAQRCPGINKGKLYTFEKIEKIKKQK
ncbi:MAG: YkgJ family cysteine cluster protein [Sedimentisphaerales bacterium]|nr:YkgJ family cysteine cluster protein [Sedimentisphaerales bacterium]